MSRNYTVRTKINKPVAAVFDAVVNSDIMTEYFTDAVSSDLIPGQEVQWTWDEWGTNAVFVKTVKPNELIELTLDSKNWQKTADESYEVLVSFEFEALDEDTTLVSISESGWLMDEDGRKASYENCGGWQDMLCCLKAYLEHGVDLRK